MKTNPDWPRPILVGGPTGIGKTSLIDALVAQYPKRFARPRSLTTRAPRVGEGFNEYRFVDRETIERLHSKGFLVSLDNAYGNLYAIERESIDTLIASQIFPIKEIHPRNFNSFRSIYPDSILSLLLPHSLHGSDPYSSDLARRRDDASYYPSLATDDFHVIVRPSETRSLAILVEDFVVSINAFLSGLAAFPLPGDIDRKNAYGYRMLAGHFNEQERPTTADFHLLTRRFFGEAIASLPVNARVLEIGPGEGWLRRSFQWPDSIEYSATDITSEMMKCAGISGDASSARSLPFPSQSFTHIFCSLGDGYCFPSAIAEIRRVLAPNGYLFFTAPSAVWASGVRHAGETSITRFTLPDSRSVEVCSFVFEGPCLKRLFEATGFSVQTAIELRGDHFPINHVPAPSIRLSADKLGTTVAKLEIVNAVIGRRGP